jgi:two-component system cell cycle sensor histidine kinase PleC
LKRRLTVFLHESRFCRSGSRLSRKNTESVQGVKILLTFASGHGESHLIHYAYSSGGASNQWGYLEGGTMTNVRRATAGDERPYAKFSDLAAWGERLSSDLMG